MSSDQITITPTNITTEAEALADAAERGLFAVARDFVGTVEDWHWHEFEATVYVLGGEACVDYDDGTTLRVGPGNIAFAPAGVVHKDVPGSKFRAVIGVNIHPSDWTEPLNKPVDQP